MKKLTAALLMCVLAFTSALTACDKSGESTPTTASTDAPTNAPDTNTPDTAPPSDDTTASAPVSSGDAGKEFNFVVFRFKSGDFTVEKNSNFNIGENCGDETPSTPKYTSSDFICAAFQQTANLPEFKEVAVKDENGKSKKDADGNTIKEWVPNGSLNPNGFLISENGDFWFNIDHITAKFYLEDKGSKVPTLPEHYQYVQPYLQMGGNPKVAKKWDWWSPTDPVVNLAHVDNDPNGLPRSSFGSKDEPLTVTWDVKTWYATVGETEPVLPDTSNPTIDEKKPDQGKIFTSGNGAQKFGIQFGRDSTNFFDAAESDLKLYVGFTDVEVFVKDKAKFMEYVNKASELTGDKWDDSLKVVEVG